MPVTELVAGEGFVRLRLNRPEKLNALDEQVRSALHAHIEQVADSPEVRVVVLEGTGRSFSAGADLAQGGSAAEGWAAARHASGGWQRLLDALESLPQVTVAKLHGHVIGGACLLAASCDIRVAAEDTQVRIPELAIGIPLTWGGVPRLVREVGMPLARDLVMTGRAMTPSELALFAQRVAAPAELDSAVDSLLDELLSMPAGPLAMTRALFSALGRERVGAAAWADADLLMWSRRQPESREAAIDYASRLAERRGSGGQPT